MEEQDEFKRLVRAKTMSETRRFFPFGVEPAYIGMTSSMFLLAMLAVFGLGAFIMAEIPGLLLTAGLSAAAIALSFAYMRWTAPAKVYADLKKKSAEALKEVTDQRDALQAQVDAMPYPEASVVSDGSILWLEVHGKNADATYSVTLDLTDTKAYAPKTPVKAMWNGEPDTAELRIVSGSWARARLMQTTDSHGLFANEFRWAGEQHRLANTVGWVLADDCPKPRGSFRAVLSSSPQMAGGARAFKIEFHGSEIVLASDVDQNLEDGMS